MSAPVEPSPDGPPPLPVSPHLLTAWYGLMSVGSLALGLFAERPSLAKGLFSHTLGHPLVVFFALVAAGLMMLKFLHQQPMRNLVSPVNLVAGFLIAVACYFMGEWFGSSLSAIP